MTVLNLCALWADCSHGRLIASDRWRTPDHPADHRASLKAPRRPCLLLVIGALVLEACQANTPSISPPPAASTPPSIVATTDAPAEDLVPDALPPPNPLDVAVRPNQGTSSTKVIGSDGGEVSLRLDDGTKVTLSIPPGAVPFATEIAVTAVTIDGWDFAPADLSAVELAPDGLELLVPGSLTFQLSPGISAGLSGQVGWAGQGTDLHPVLGAPDDDGATISIDHFSGYGFGWNLNMGYWGEWEQWQGRTWQAYLEKELAVIFGWEQQKQLLLGGEEPGETLTQTVMGVIHRWCDWVYGSFMATAGTSCDNARAAATAQVAMAKQLSQMGLNLHHFWEQFVAERQAKGWPTPYSFDGLTVDFATQLVAICDKEALEACLLTGDLGLLLLYVRDRTRILDLSAQPVLGVGNGLELIERCAQYRVDFDATFLVDLTSGDPEHPYWESRHQWHTRLRVWTSTGSGWTQQIVGTRSWVASSA